jgi:hypothetical protein
MKKPMPLKKKAMPQKKITTKIIRVSELGIPPEYSLSKIGITQSFMQEWHRCRIAFLLTLHRWRKIGSGIKTGFGSLWHEISGNIYKHCEVKKELPADKLIMKWINDFTKYKKDQLRGKTIDDIERDKAIVYVLATEYIRYYSDDFKNMRFYAIERTSFIKYGNCILRRKVDGNYLDKQKRVFLLENKTKGKINSEILLKALSIDFQTQFYVLTEEEEKGIEIAGVLYNIIRNPGHSVGKKETLAGFMVRFRKEVQQNPEHFFLRYFIPFDKKSKIKFREELQNKLDDIQAFLDGKLKIYPMQSACNGEYPCDFLNACSSDCLVGYEKGKEYFPELEIGL